MFKSLISIVFWLLSSSAFAAAKEMDATAPVETVSMIYVVIFGILFVGMIVGFFIYLFMTDKKAPEDSK
jgi:hypothetical protein